MTLTLVGNSFLRRAIRRNLVTFPAQVEPFMKRTANHLHERIVQLYFLRGWSVPSIAARYSLNRAQVQRLLTEWRIRAIASGCIQEIEPNCLAVLLPQVPSTVDTGREGLFSLQGKSTFADSPPWYAGKSDLSPTTLWPSRSKSAVDGECNAAS